MEVLRGKVRLPPRVVLYGVEGIGKSTFANNAPKPIFLPTEDGLGEIDCERLPLATSYQQFVDNLGWLCQDKHEYQTAVVDTLDWLEKLIWADVCRANNKKSIEEIGYAKGYHYALDQWKEVIAGLDYLRRERGMAVILLAHAKIEKFNDPESQAYDRYTLAIHKFADAYVREWCDAVLFASRKKRIEVQDVGFNKTRAIAKPVGGDGGDRVMRANESPVCSAKNRFGITGEIPLSWEAFAQNLS